MTTQDLLAGLRVLVVEDESIVSMLLEGYLDELGCTVIAVASQLTDGFTKAASLEIDAAILDVNLSGELSYPIAQVLTQRGIPFVFATGYGIAGLPEELSHASVLAKPFRLTDLRDALCNALRQRLGLINN